MDVSLSELRELVVDSEACRAEIHGVAKSWRRLSDWTELNWLQYFPNPWLALYFKQEKPGNLQHNLQISKSFLLLPMYRALTVSSDLRTTSNLLVWPQRCVFVQVTNWDWVSMKCPHCCRSQAIAVKRHPQTLFLRSMCFTWTRVTTGIFICLVHWCFHSSLHGIWHIVPNNCSKSQFGNCQRVNKQVIRANLTSIGTTWVPRGTKFLNVKKLTKIIPSGRY